MTVSSRVSGVLGARVRPWRLPRRPLPAGRRRLATAGSPVDGADQGDLAVPTASPPGPVFDDAEGSWVLLVIPVLTCLGLILFMVAAP